MIAKVTSTMTSSRRCTSPFALPTKMQRSTGAHEWWKVARTHDSSVAGSLEPLARISVIRSCLTWPWTQWQPCRRLECRKLMSSLLNVLFYWQEPKRTMRWGWNYVKDECNCEFLVHFKVYAALGRCKQDIKSCKGILPSVPLHLRNAPTKLMKEMGCGAGYNTRHRDHSGLHYMPEGMEDTQYFDNWRFILTLFPLKNELK